jgi:DNA/RNA-binding domain of Phe-tRNA-synthetase-like protein
MMIQVSDAWRKTFPGAVVGLLLVQNVTNPPEHGGLEAAKTDLEQDLRNRYSGYSKADFNNLASVKPYAEYYDGHKKTYHVQLQLESVTVKGKSLPRVAALVEAMFMAELKNQMLTAGHDFDAIQGEILLNVSNGDEVYTMLNGKEQILKPRDMYMRDSTGIISSVVYGPDQRTCITPRTKNALFVVYAPAGIGVTAVENHLHDLQRNVAIISPASKAEPLTIITAP